MLLSGAIGLWGAAAQGQDKGKAARFYEDALSRYEKKDFPGAIIQLKNALQVDSNMLPVQLLLGKALLQNGDVIAAEVALSEALKMGVNRAEVVLLLGQAYVAQGKHKLVLEQSTFNPAGLPPPVQLKLHLLKASTYVETGDVRGALRSIDEARAIDASSPDVWLAEVPIRIRTRQLKEATAAVDKGLALAPTSAAAWHQKGSIQHVQGDLRAALASYDRVLQTDAESNETRVARIGIYMDTGRYEDAAKDVAELQRLSPRDPRGAYLKALLAEREGNPAAAAAALKQVTDLLDPVPVDFIRYRPQFLMLNGLAHFGLKQSEKAKQYLEAFQRAQNNSPVSKLLARLYLADGNQPQAISVLETYLKAQPGDGQAMTLLANAHMALGRHAKATALMQEALKTQDNPAFRTSLGLSLVGSGQAANGIVELEAAYKKDPSQKQAATALVRLYQSGGQPQKALPIADKLVKQEPSNAGYYNLLGVIQAQTGDAGAARSSFEKALQLNNALTPAKINLARLEIAAKAYDAASKRLNDLLTEYGNNGEVMFELAVIADRKGLQTEAQRWIEKARDTSGPKELRWGLALVDFHLRNGRPGPALEAAKLASGKAPEDLATLISYSRAQLATGDTVGAKNTLGTATRFAEYSPNRQFEIAGLQMAANNAAGAAYSLEKALSSRPDYLPARALMTEVELRQGDVPKAEKSAREIATQYPKQSIGHSLVGDVAWIKGQKAAAIDAYRRAHQVEPSTDTLLRLFRALGAHEGGKPAMQLAEQWLKSKPGDLSVRRVLANEYVVAGNYAAAQSNYQEALKLNPDDADILNNLANVQLRLKNPEAVKTAEAALAKAPGNAVMTDTLGWVLFHNGQTDRALQLLRDARLRLPDNAEIRYHLAVVLVQTGRKAEAKEELNAALKSGNRLESKAEAEKLMLSL